MSLWDSWRKNKEFNVGNICGKMRPWGIILENKQNL